MILFIINLMCLLSLPLSLFIISQLLSILIYIRLQMYSIGYVERWDTLFSVFPYPILSLW